MSYSEERIAEHIEDIERQLKALKEAPKNDKTARAFGTTASRLLRIASEAQSAAYLAGFLAGININTPPTTAKEAEE